MGRTGRRTTLLIQQCISNSKMCTNAIQTHRFSGTGSVQADWVCATIHLELPHRDAIDPRSECRQKPQIPCLHIEAIINGSPASRARDHDDVYPWACRACPTLQFIVHGKGSFPGDLHLVNACLPTEIHGQPLVIQELTRPSRICFAVDGILSVKVFLLLRGSLDSCNINFSF
jgi:hypothetical protein